ncbi:MAG: alpha/beta fold hydrolase [Chloroflexi bacterium]|nr:alpha/beta fold hydrolase [Chloroflexota bacterium]
MNYSDAVLAINAVIEAENSAGNVNPVCLTRLLLRGGPAERAVLFLHGFTSCPQLFAPLGNQFFDLGYNIFIPRLPYHGNVDTLTQDLQAMSAEELFAFVERCVDLARALGNHLTVVGLSLGASLTAWLAQHRGDVDLAVPISPMFRPYFLSRGGVGLFVALAQRLPNFYIWWDPRTKEKNPAVYPYSYPGFPLRAFTQVVRVGMIAERQARRGQPAAKRILMVSNACDLAVSNSAINNVVKWWSRGDQSCVSAYEFERKYKLPHDLITPECPGSRIDIVYPKLLELIQTCEIC